MTGKDEFKGVRSDILNLRYLLSGDVIKVVQYTNLAFRIEVWAGELEKSQHTAILKTRTLDEVTRVCADRKSSED